MLPHDWLHLHGKSHLSGVGHSHALELGECRDHPAHDHDDGSFHASGLWTYWSDLVTTECTDRCPRNEVPMPEPKAEAEQHREASHGRQAGSGSTEDLVLPSRSTLLWLLHAAAGGLLPGWSDGPTRDAVRDLVGRLLAIDADGRHFAVKEG